MSIFHTLRRAIVSNIGTGGLSSPTIFDNAFEYVTFSNSDRTIDYVGGHSFFGTVIETYGMTSGKYYCEATLSTSGGEATIFGLANESKVVGYNGTTHRYLGQESNSWGMYAGALYGNNAASPPTGIATPGNGDIVRFAIDIDNKKLWLAVGSGNWIGSGGAGDPVAGTLPTFTLSGNTFYVGQSVADSAHSIAYNFGQSAFAYEVPTGYIAGIGT